MHGRRDADLKKKIFLSYFKELNLELYKTGGKI